MAGTGPAPRPASGRTAARKKAGQGAILVANPEVKKPPLPDVREWHELTLAWWDDVWASPMAGEYDESDKHGLFVMAMVVNDFWTAETARARQEASSEIRLMGVRFGTSPIDRRRLQWEIEKVDEAQQRGAKRRRTSEEPSSGSKITGDPRNVLRAL